MSARELTVYAADFLMKTRPDVRSSVVENSDRKE